MTIQCVSCHVYPASRPHSLCDFCWDECAALAFTELLHSRPLPYGTWLVDWFCAQDPYEALGVWECAVREHPQYEDLCEQLGDEPSLLTLVDVYSDEGRREYLYPVDRLHWFLVSVGYAIARALPKGGNP